MSKKIETTNKRILKFYNDNPNINFEAVNLVFIELMEKLINDMSSTLNASVNSQILSSVTELTNKFGSLNDSVGRMGVDMNTNILLKFVDLKKEYIEDVKNIVQTNTTDRLASLIEKNNSHLIDKTQLILNEVVPKSNEVFYKQIKDTMQIFQTSISADTNKLMQSMNSESFAEFMTNFDTKTSKMFQTVQQPIFSFISASEERINSSIGNLKDSSSTSQITQEKVLGELTEFLNRYRNSSHKGKFGENQLNTLLTQMFNTAEIINTTGIKASGDFIMKRDNKPTILFENKAYDHNVEPEEIKKFIRDIDEQKCHGVFLSQHTGITSKPNYHIEFHKGNVLIYIHSVEYSREKIQLAVDVIDNLSIKLIDLNDEEEENSIPKEILEDINKEFQVFVTQKEAIITILKDSNKKMLTQLEELKFPGLEKYLSTKFASVQKSGSFTCELCNIYSSTTLKGIAAHKRGCSKKNIVIQTQPSA
jgi:hypothetical protein